VVVEYQLDDYADQYIAWYHKECEPDKNDMVGYKSITRIREVRSCDLDKKIGHNQGRVITEQKRKNLLDIIKEKQPIKIKDLLHAQSIYSGGGFYSVIKNLTDDGKIKRVDNIVSIMEE
jgi:flagellar biosynthesis component FlhA